MENRREFVDHKKRQDQIKEVISDEGPLVIKKIASSIGLTYEVTYQELQYLVAEGELVSWKKKNRNIYALPGTQFKDPILKEGSQSISTVTHADYDNKECGGCGEVKSREEFGPGETYCRDCNRERVRKARAEDKEEKLLWQTPELWPGESTSEIWILSRILPMLFKAKVFTIKTTEYKVTAAYSDHNTLIEAYTNLPMDLQEKTKITIDQSRDACRLTIPLEG